MENEDRTERIDRYLDDELTAAEKIAFGNEMATDADLRLEVEAQEAVRNLISSRAEKEELRRMFAAFHSELNAGGTQDVATEYLQKEKGILRKVKWGGWSYLAVAASVALTIIGVWTFIKVQEPLGNQTGIRVESRNETFRVPLLTWRTVDFKPVLQDRRMIDVSIIRDQDHTSHYKFTNILEIYSDQLTEKQQKISIAYDVDTKQYRLHIGNSNYLIRKTEQITPLTQP
nr:hypothetical protein [uncultured Dyadobacter sp.]